MNKFIVIEGPIGVGKTTLARMLSDRWQAEAIYETFEENPFLTADFYKNPSLYAFNTEVFFLLSRVREQKMIMEKTKTIVADYFFEKNILFSKLNLSPDDLETYQKVYKTFETQTRTPDLVVYLYADVPTLLQRVELRDRHFERALSSDYMTNLAQNYDEFFKDYDKAPVIPVDTRGLDFVREPSDFLRIVGLIEERILGYRQLSLRTRGRSRNIVNA